MSQQQPTYDEQIDAQRRTASHQAAAQSLSRVQQQHMEETYKNPDFLEKLADADVDSELHDWLEAELGPAFSEARIKGNMDEDYPRRRELLNANAVDRYVTERTPGRCLRQHPKLHALAQGIVGTPDFPDPTENPAFRGAITAPKRRVVEEAFEVKTLLESLSAEGEGTKAVSTATTENRTVGNDDREKSGVKARVAGVFG